MDINTKCSVCTNHIKTKFWCHQCNSKIYCSFECRKNDKKKHQSDCGKKKSETLDQKFESLKIRDSENEKPYCFHCSKFNPKHDCPTKDCGAKFCSDVHMKLSSHYVKCVKPVSKPASNKSNVQKIVIPETRFGISLTTRFEIIGTLVSMIKFLLVALSKAPKISENIYPLTIVKKDEDKFSAKHIKSSELKEICLDQKSLNFIEKEIRTKYVIIFSDVPKKGNVHALTLDLPRIYNVKEDFDMDLNKLDLLKYSFFVKSHKDAKDFIEKYDTKETYKLESIVKFDLEKLDTLFKNEV